TTVTATKQTPPDLVVDSVTPAATAAKFGDQISLSWVVRNVGGAATGKWSDRVYLSRDTTLSADDTVLATLPANSPATLPPGGTYTGSTTVTLPVSQSLPPGKYYLIVLTDAGQTLTETDETNNATAGPAV